MVSGLIPSINPSDIVKVMTFGAIFLNTFSLEAAKTYNCTQRKVLPRLIMHVGTVTCTSPLSTYVRKAYPLRRYLSRRLICVGLAAYCGVKRAADCRLFAAFPLLAVIPASQICQVVCSFFLSARSWGCVPKGWEPNDCHLVIDLSSNRPVHQ